MFRRIFDERKYHIAGNVLPLVDFRLFCDLPHHFQIQDSKKQQLIHKAEKALEDGIPLLLAHEYMLFCKTGSRVEFQDKYFQRRVMMLDLAMGEYVEGSGRFIEKLADLIWLVLDESSWVVPAHNHDRREADAPYINLPYAFGDDVDYIDLFSAETAANLAVCYYLCRDQLDALSTGIRERLISELNRRIFNPYLDDGIMYSHNKWSGLRGTIVNNWGPWIVSNILTACAFIVEDMEIRTAIVERSLPLLDNFSASNHPDGGCDEGPVYWELAGGSLWAACLVLHDMTAGYIHMFDDPLLRNMGEYEVKMIAANGRLLSFSDALSNYIPNPYLLYHWGVTCKSNSMMDCACWLLTDEDYPIETERRSPYRYMRYLTTPQLLSGPCNFPSRIYMESLQIAVTRPSGQIDKGLYLAVKGGHNGEGHNHNDLGTVVVYSDDLPLFIDAGVGEYTKRYFGPDRYTVWNVCSDYHNCATFNGVTQKAGRQFRAEDVVYCEQSGMLSMSLLHAYPEESGLESYSRSASLQDGVAIVDSVAFRSPGTVMFSWITVAKPQCVKENSFQLQGRTVTFDPSLEYRLEVVDTSAPETEPIPGFWGGECLYRITLTSKLPVLQKKYILTVQ